jgi:hypothetical protein
MARELPGEADLRALSERFREAERRIRALIGRAVETSLRREHLTEALLILIMLRREDFRGPVISAYLMAFRQVRRGGEQRGAADLAGSLAQKLDGGAQTAAIRVRDAFRVVTADNLEVVVDDAVTAHIDDRGTRCPLLG